MYFTVHSGFDLHFHITDHYEEKLRQGLRAGPWGLELKQRPRRDAAYWLASSTLFSQLSSITKVYLPTGGSIHSGLGSPTSSIKKTPHRFSRRPIWWKQFISCCPLFPSDSNMCLDLNSEIAHHKKNGSRVLGFNGSSVEGSLEKKEKVNSKQTSQFRMIRRKS